MQKPFFLPFFLKTLLFLTIAVGMNPALSEVEPPNYNFSLDTLKDFYPGKTLGKIKTKYKNVTLEFDKGASKIYKTYITHIRYKFPIYFRIFEDKTVSLFARLPSYFLHDVFHQSLINRYQKQDEYNKVGNTAVYIWKDKENLKLTYQGQCTITCFPMYLSVEMVKAPEGFPGETGILGELSNFQFK
ncbi:MAG: hypothetical protein VXV96_14115 [Bdellovibrionota bacterium]|nr:hypothetical protein [Bdellovibrionota bacterium]